MNEQTSLFTLNDKKSLNSPLAYRMRPENLSDYAGQQHILSRINSLNLNKLPNIVFWGPPGCGKTTLAKILANESGHTIHTFNAVLSGVPELRKLIERVKNSLSSKKQIIFIDEIHRFNKAQQDALLPHVEKGDFILFGATTEYPQTSLNRALLSRVTLFELKHLNANDILNIIERTLEDQSFELDEEVLSFISHYSNGDARFALNLVEELMSYKTDSINLNLVKSLISNASRYYDKNGNRHYDVISAFIKSMRGSDVEASLLWLAVMIDGGEDPVFIARRLMIFASEDVGLADPQALLLANAAHYTVSQIGMPEGRITLSHVVSYLALAPKSNSVYNAINSALDFVKNRPTIEVPTHLQNNHPDKNNYKYPHSYPNNYVSQDYSGLNTNFYKPCYNEEENKLVNNLKNIKKS